MGYLVMKNKFTLFISIIYISSSWSMQKNIAPLTIDHQRPPLTALEIGERIWLGQKGLRKKEWLCILTSIESSLPEEMEKNLSPLKEIKDPDIVQVLSSFENTSKNKCSFDWNKEPLVAQRIRECGIALQTLFKIPNSSAIIN